jgi:hypothetical protein
MVTGGFCEVLVCPGPVSTIPVTLKPTPESRDRFRDRIFGKVLENVGICVQNAIIAK